MHAGWSWVCARRRLLSLENRVLTYSVLPAKPSDRGRSVCDRHPASSSPSFSKLYRCASLAIFLAPSVLALFFSVSPRISAVDRSLLPPHLLIVGRIPTIHRQHGELHVSMVREIPFPMSGSPIAGPRLLHWPRVEILFYPTPSVPSDEGEWNEA